LIRNSNITIESIKNSSSNRFYSLTHIKINSVEDLVMTDSNPKAQVKKKSGGQSYEATHTEEEVLTALVTTGAPQRLISWYMQKDIKTLKKMYAHVFDMPPNDNESKTNMVEYSLFYQAAYNKNLGACIFWLKAHRPQLYAERFQGKGETEIDQGELLACIAKALKENKS